MAGIILLVSQRERGESYIFADTEYKMIYTCDGIMLKFPLLKYPFRH